MKESLVKFDVISNTDGTFISITCRRLKFFDPSRFLRGGIVDLGFTLEYSDFDQKPTNLLRDDRL